MKNENVFIRVKALNNVLDKSITHKKPSLETKKLNLYISNEDLLRKVEKLFIDGHHARAVEEAYKYLDNRVKKLSEIHNDLSGSKLMTNVFSVNNPTLLINDNITTSEKDEQQGYMQILSGCMTGIRNPRAHESDWEDSEETALKLLVLADHLLQKVNSSHKA